MKKITWLLIPVLLVAGIMSVLVQPVKQLPVNKKFKRSYHNNGLVAAAHYKLPLDIHVLSAWKTKLVGYSMEKQELVLFDSAGHISKSVPFHPATNVSFFHSLSIDSQYVYAMAVNDRKVLRTDLSDTLIQCDTILKGSLGIVKNPADGYIIFRCDEAKKNAGIYSLKDGKESELFTLEYYGDRGMSHMGQLIKDCNNERFFYIPYYNSRVIEYNYRTGQTTIITTIEQQPVQDLSVRSGDQRILSSKAPVVNRKGAANSDFLFVLSYARSEDDGAADHCIIDVYSAVTGKYSCSVALPGIRSKEIVAFTCTAKQIVFSYQDQLYYYDIHPNELRP